MAFGWRRRERFDEYDDHYLYLRHRNRRHATLTGFCLFVAFILFLFIALSLPIIKSVYLLEINGHPSSSLPTTSIGTELRFGVWGFCVTRFVSPKFCSFVPHRRPLLTRGRVRPLLCVPVVIFQSIEQAVVF